MTEDLGELVLALSLRRLWRRDTQSVVKGVHDYLHAVLPEWQAPQRIQLFIELPRSPLNKVLRREVRAALESDRGVLPRTVLPRTVLPGWCTRLWTLLGPTRRAGPREVSTLAVARRPLPRRGPALRWQSRSASTTEWTCASPR